jgi:chromosome partitioning protein
MTPPKTVIVANPKGGCGKSTIAINIACGYASMGRDVVLIDHDVQQSSFDWVKARPKKCAPIKVLKPSAEIPIDYCAIHDMPAAVKVGDITALMQGNYRLVIPILPSPTDIKAGARFLMSLEKSGHQINKDLVTLIANRVNTRASYYRVLQAFLKNAGYPLAATIRDTQNYVRSADAGLSIFDLPASRVGTDLTQFGELMKWLERF